MKSFKLNIWLAALIVAGLQTSALAYMVVERANLLKHGREIVLDVRPVDPRSLFRGDYVILNYGNVSRLPKYLFKDIPNLRQSMPIFVTLRNGAEGWQPVAAGPEHPAQKISTDEAVLKGWLENKYSGRINYGIEAFFVPEGKGKELEKMIRAGQIKAVLAVGGNGSSGLKALEVEGRRQYDQPLY